MNSITRKLNAHEWGRIWFRSTRRLFETAPRPQRELVVFLGISGSMRYFIDGSLLTLRRQELLFVASGQSHFLVSETPNFEMVVASLSPELLDDNKLEQPWESANGNHQIAPRSIQVSAMENLLRLASDLVAESRSNVLRLGLSWWLNRATEAWVDAEFRNSTSLHSSVTLALTAMNEDPGLSIGDIANQANLTTSRLGLLFRRQCGITMQTYREDKRLDTLDAKMSLRPDQPLLEAALESGFGDYSSFYRAFKKRRKLSPREYYKRHLTTTT